MVDISYLKGKSVKCYKRGRNYEKTIMGSMGSSRLAQRYLELEHWRTIRLLDFDGVLANLLLLG